jgi:hypothetical protein
MKTACKFVMGILMLILVLVWVYGGKSGAKDVQGTLRFSWWGEEARHKGTLLNLKNLAIRILETIQSGWTLEIGLGYAEHFAKFEELFVKSNAIERFAFYFAPKFQGEETTRYADVTVYPLVTDGVEGAVIRVDDVTERVQIEEMMLQIVGFPDEEYAYEI